MLAYHKHLPHQIYLSTVAKVVDKLNYEHHSNSELWPIAWMRTQALNLYLHHLPGHRILMEHIFKLRKISWFCLNSNWIVWFEKMVKNAKKWKFILFFNLKKDIWTAVTIFSIGISKSCCVDRSCKFSNEVLIFTLNLCSFATQHYPKCLYLFQNTSDRWI